ncbi:MAG: glycosyltransferase family 39 protein, partial [Deltaproteobacteria bacterium]|nr:glycosyltransferase family 39 protein [Deltaproteobacteria bacterium]
MELDDACVRAPAMQLRGGGGGLASGGRVRPRLIGLALACATTLLVLVNGSDIGLARDEIVYMQNGDRYADWWIDLARHGATLGRATAKGELQGIERTFGGPNPTDNNREHPPLMKTLYGLSHRLLHGVFGVDEVRAYRAPAAVLHGLLVLLVYAMVLELWGLAEAVVSALLLVFLPRALFHAGLAAFDAPIMALWFLAVYAYWRCLDGRRWPWQAGVAFGLALATKHNAVLLPFAFGLHHAIVGIRARGLAGIVAYRWRVIVSLAVLGPLVLIALWPWLWLSPITHAREWIAFHTSHVHYNFEYLGRNWNAPPFPWHVALVTTAFTVPVATLAAAALGAWRWLADRARLGDARAPTLLLVLSAGASLGPFFLGSTPIFGAEKHWMPALPSIAIAAGVGTVWAARRLGGARRAAVAGVCAVVIGAAAVETVIAQPHALTWYNALAGGAPGGADLGMNRQFWGIAARGALPFLADQPPGAVYSHDASPAWGLYQKRGDVAPSMPDAGHEVAGIAASKYALVI